MRILLFCLLFLVGGTAAAQQRVSLAIETAAGIRHEFQVEIADTPESKAQGLMFRRELAADHGMLFIFERPQRISMWMKNTPLPLDMLFIDADGVIVDLHARTVPFSLDTIASRRRALYVLEVNGGTADRLGIAVGDRVSGAGIAGAGIAGSGG
jgi:uncharacterized membrane protein (UPF0127 family)